LYITIVMIIETRGIAELTTRALAEEVGLTTGAMFRHFDSVDALLEAVVSRVEAVLDATYPPADLEPCDRLLRFIEMRSSAVGHQRGILRLMLSEQFALALPARGAERLGRCVERTWSFVLGAVREGQQLGSIRADIDARALTVLILGVVQTLALGHGGPLPRIGPKAGSLVREGLSRMLGAPKVARTKTKERKT
jgi:AcrR family transcriptional regulator